MGFAPKVSQTADIRSRGLTLGAGGGCQEQNSGLNKNLGGDEREIETGQENTENSFNDVIDTIHTIDKMVRGNITKTPKKPDFVEAQEMVFNFWNAKLSVQLIKGYGDKPDPLFVLSLHRSFFRKEDGKWKDESIRISKVEDWEEIKKIIDEKFAIPLNWISKDEALAELERKTPKKTVKEIIDKRPNLAIDILRNVDLEKFDSTQLSDFLNTLSDKDRDAIGHEIKLFDDIVKSLNPKDTKSIDSFLEILEKVSMHGIDLTMRFVLGRLEKIKIFEDIVNNDKTYELKGKNSIHKFLDRNIWILDENYMILSSNEVLKVGVGDGYNKKHKKSVKMRRPDFVLKAYKNDLVIAEIKRPDYKIKIEDLIQLMEYKSIANELSGKKFVYNGFIIGKKFGEDVKAYSEDISGIHTISYSDIISEVMGRYKRLSEILEEEMREDYKT